MRTPAMMRCACLLLLLPLARPIRAAEGPTVPANLVLDIRLFETRSENPDYAAMRTLGFSIATDGRGVTANQWLATVSKKAPGAFLAALGYDTVRAREGLARAAWTNRSRSFAVEVRLEGFHPSEAFKARVTTAMTRGEDVVREHARDIELRLGQTTAWSGEELEIPVSEYLSHFREYRDREQRGLLYEELRFSTVFLVILVTPRLLSEEEAFQLDPESLTLSADAVPEIDNPFGMPVMGTVVLGFELDPSGRPFDAQVLRSTLPEANPRLLGEAAKWTFPPGGGPLLRRWGRLELKLELP